MPPRPLPPFPHRDLRPGLRAPSPPLYMASRVGGGASARRIDTPRHPPRGGGAASPDPSDRPVPERDRARRPSGTVPGRRSRPGQGPRLHGAARLACGIRGGDEGARGRDLSLINRSMRKEGFPAILTRGRTSHETQAIFGRTDHLDPQRTRGRRLGGRPGPQARRRRAAGPPLEIEVRRHDGLRPQAAQASSKENLRLKRMVADLSLDMRMLEDVIEMSKKW